MRHVLSFAVCTSLLGLAGTAQAEPVEYTIDAQHTYPSFKAPHLGLSFWRGKFNQSRGSLTMDREAGTGTVRIEIDASSVDFGHDKMNEHAMNEDFFNVAEYPTITYEGRLRFDGDTPTGVDGKLTMLGVTQPVELTIDHFNCIDHPLYKVEACGADAHGQLDRADFGMTYGGQAGTGVELQIQVEAVRKQ